MTNEKAIYTSVREAAENIGCAHVSILRVLKSKNLLKGIYKINYVDK